MAPCPKSTRYKGWTWEWSAHIKSHCVFYIPPVTKVILPSIGISSQAILSPTSWRNVHSFFQLPKALLQRTISGGKKKGGGNNVAGSKKTAANTPNGKVSREERKMATPHIACLGTQSLAPSQHFKPFGFAQGLRKKTFFFFFFLSVQTRTMNSSSPQKCDKVSTTPTRKVIYGWPDGLELP